MWLIGELSSTLPEKVLPTNLDVLKTFFFGQESKISNDENFMKISQKVSAVWNNFGLPTALQQNIITKMKNLIQKYKLLRKNKYRITDKQIANEDEFTRKLLKLFDISHVDIDDLAKYRISLVFLEDQNMARTMTTDDLDGVEECFRSQSKPKKLKKEHDATLTSHDDDFENQLTQYEKQILKPINENSTDIQKFIDSSDVSAALDRTNISNRKFVMLAGSMIKATKTNLNKVKLSRSTISRRRTLHRKNIQRTIKVQFMKNAISPMVVHWDGKLLADTTNEINPKIKCDRIAVVVTGTLKIKFEFIFCI
jgi:hypothetical protein